VCVCSFGCCAFPGPRPLPRSPPCGVLLYRCLNVVPSDIVAPPAHLFNCPQSPHVACERTRRWAAVERAHPERVYLWADSQVCAVSLPSVCNRLIVVGIERRATFECHAIAIQAPMASFSCLLTNASSVHSILLAHRSTPSLAPSTLLPRRKFSSLACHACRAEAQSCFEGLVSIERLAEN
jgi:hypothetical protein